MGGGGRLIHRSPALAEEAEWKGSSGDNNDANVTIAERENPQRGNENGRRRAANIVVVAAVGSGGIDDNMTMEMAGVRGDDATTDGLVRNG